DLSGRFTPWEQSPSNGAEDMLQTSGAFKENATSAMANAGLQRALTRARPQYANKRQAAVDRLPEFEALREEAKNIKNHAIANLDFYLEIYAANVEKAW